MLDEVKSLEIENIALKESLDLSRKEINELKILLMTSSSSLDTKKEKGDDSP